MKSSFIFLLLIAFSLPATAAEFKGMLQSIAAGPNLENHVFIRVVGQSANAEWSTSCSSNSFWSFKLDTSQAGGKETYSLLLSAYTSGKEVVINGTGSCSSEIGSDIQNLYYVRFNF